MPRLSKFKDSRELAIHCVDNIIKNCKKDFRDNVINDVVSKYNDGLFEHKMLSFIRSNYLFPAKTPMTVDYWLARGYDEKEALVQIHEVKKSKKRVSPFSLEHWLKRINPNTGELYTVEEAEYKRNSMRPIRKEYWIENFGYDEETATIKANETKSENNKKGSQTSKCSVKKKVNNRLSVEYYTLRGYDENTAKDIISNLQRTFSKDICIEKYGYDEGIKVWRDRQIKWQKSIIDNNDMNELNLKKNPYFSLVGLPKDEIISRVKSMNKKDDVFIAFNKNELLDYINMLIDNKPYLLMTDAEHIMTKLKIYNYFYIGEDFDIVEFIKNNIMFIDDKHITYIDRNKYSNFFYKTDEFCLKSSDEINFYIWCKQYNIEFEYGKRYENSNKRYDFYLPKYDIIIEIAGFLQDEKYYQNMLFKQNTYNAVIVEPKDLKKFLQELLDGNFNRDDYKIL